MNHPHHILMTDMLTPTHRHTHTELPLTEAAQLADDVGQADIGDTFQLAADVGRDGLATDMPRLYVPRHQRHGGVERVKP